MTEMASVVSASTDVATASDELPEGWVLAGLTKVCDLNPAKPAKDALDEATPTTFVPMPAVDAESGTILTPSVRPFGEVRKGFTSFRDGDVIFAKITPCMENGKSAIARGLTNGLGFGSTEFHVLRPTPAVLAQYVHYFVRQESFRRAAAEEMTGSVGQKRVPAAYLDGVSIPLPPLAEQKRIVAEIERLLAEVNKAREHLDRVPKLLKRFRQSILAAATTGRLTEDWRIQGESESGSALTERLLARHLAAWKGWQLAVASRKSMKYPTPNLARTEDWPELPESWTVGRLGMLGADPLAAVQTGPFGALLHTDEFVNQGVPVVAVGNLTGLGFTREGLYFVTPQKAEQLSKFDVNAGDLLFARSGATLGKVCVAPDFVHDWRMTGHILRVRLSPEYANPAYASFALRGNPTVVAQVFDQVRGVTRPGYNTELLESIDLPLPPVSEQQEIVRRVNALFAVAEQVEASWSAAARKAQTTPQAILAKAFRGELVPTEAELARTENRPYESATQLLTRVKVEEAASTQSAAQSAAKKLGQSQPARRRRHSTP